MTDPVRRPGGRTARVHAQVMAATVEILLEEGLDGATVPAIAERSGVSHVSIYRKWKDRGSLIREALLETIDTAVAVPDTGNVKDDLMSLFAKVIAAHQAPLGRVLLDVTRSGDPSLSELQHTLWRTRRDSCALIIERAIERGEVVKDTDHRLIFEFMLGPILSRGLMTAEGLESLQPEKIVGMILRGAQPAH
ncbi:TetR/AcrR family transcriptional regulator [Mycobacteroides immunogenum]|uniref:HTH tetR-type domain-containing protein n=1 Tax=Mycobacteroides immunogenum TaxID=83262 RepID=A0A7V8RYK7_9MYCO|nr:TetR/AcrR family transcriptional regulator [Mycobacteroides immunogenum]AMT73322.1 hypothetical protein ABG82_26695 [Mycobacteroides immunogenum]ANO06483.1 hypothetical protein BAB75_26955 [Mycobacteroides immunogenum]KIU39718.1 hypothetical protein TL11_15210 [Mycobacteroides immunogenum]KPG10716.1 hypothetical protein AN909_10220 [Mycobacteroides immunogenum]KPG12853.1 hypothetical protein AN910_10915 [Mycobacteroides immunogenum]